jgi:hypothetical protein
VEKFLGLPRYPFNPGTLEHAPEEKGIYGLFDGTELIYLGKTSPGGHASIRFCLLEHFRGNLGDCTKKATAYTWELSLWPDPRETEILARYAQRNGRRPRCQDKVG